MPSLREEQSWLTVGSLMIVATVALAVGLSYASTILIPFTFAVFIVSLVSPLVDYQVVRFKIPRAIAVGLALLVVLTIIAVICMQVAEAIQTVIATAGSYSDSFVSLAKRIMGTLEKWGVHLEQEKMLKDLQSWIPGLVTQTFGTAISLVSFVILVTIFVIFLLAGRNPYTVRSGIYAEIDQKIRRYIAIKVALSSVTGILVWIVLASFGLELAGVFGMMAFLLNFIPSIGSIVATLLPIPIAVAQFDNPWTIVWIVTLPAAIQMVIGNGLEPKLMGEGMGLHPVTIILSLAFWSLLWGPVGMLLAVPMTAIIRIVLMHFETVRPIGKLLAGELPGLKTGDG